MNILTLFLLYVIYLILMVMVRLISISLLLASLIIRGRLLVRVLWGLWWWRVGVGVWVWVFWVLGELCTIFILRVGLGIRGIEDGRINDFQMLLFLYFGPIAQYLQLIFFMEMVLNQLLKDMNTFST